MKKQKRKAATETGVSMVTCTNKLPYMYNIFNNYGRQIIENKELIIILNNDQLSLADWQERSAIYPNITVYQLPESATLGECLNFAAERSQFEVIAKFDDDDFYSRFYVSSALHALRTTKADIIGKSAYHTYLEEDKSLSLRFPNRENAYTTQIAGATLLFRKKVFQRVRFQHISLGEDVAFLRDCRLSHFKIFTTNRYNYVCNRRTDPNLHTWKPSKEYFLSTGILITHTDDYRKFVVQESL
ncbi:glycosyltransferase [Paenibacillus sinopodophylli]|uniref:glycosyltransferase n=1 Tax=Paenibacillus sinopodophylli TaxID=1837342 RepID=UPI001FE526C9|nr:glycosyltransferase [Paenibacillus sinopodophylli]